MAQCLWETDEITLRCKKGHFFCKGDKCTDFEPIENEETA